MEHHFLLRQERGSTSSSSCNGVVRRGSLPLKKRKLLSGEVTPATSLASCSATLTTSSGMPLSSLLVAKAAPLWSLPALPDLSSPSPWQRLDSMVPTSSRHSMSLTPTHHALQEPLLLSPGPAAVSASSSYYGGDEHMAALALLSAASRNLQGAAAGMLPFPPAMPLLPKMGNRSCASSDAAPATSSLKARVHDRNHVLRMEGDAMMKALHGEQDDDEDDDGSCSLSGSSHTSVTSRRSDDDNDRKNKSYSNTTGTSFATAFASSSSRPPPTVAVAASALPNPGGCHGRCARSGAYCQRQGSFRGSKYCKLHYHRYVGGEDDDDDADVNAERTNGTRLGASGGTAADGNSSSNHKGPGHSHQDKRYTGAPWEVRCQATTTRGRPCAYVAAAEGKAALCNLHAYSFKTQGPRKGSGASSATTPAKGAGTSVKSAEGATVAPPQLKSPVQGGRTVTVSLPSTTTASSMSDEAPPTPGKMKSNVSKRRAKHNDSPHPLLSKVPVDQWQGKLVKIACGPMAGKVGTVDRWGNGWITVRVAGVGSHNRRSFELYLVDGAPGEEQGRMLPTSPSSSLHRSTVSPSPSSDSGSTTLKSVAPSIVHKVSYSYDGDDATPLGTTTRSEADKAALVLETPRNDRPLIDGLLASAFRGQGATGSDGAHAIITPVSPKRARTELPLSESLALAQEGNAKKYRIDMLFGTAALERGRRSVHHRPSGGNSSDSSTSK